MTNSSDMALQLQNQINKLRGLCGEKKPKIISALRNTNAKFPVEQRIWAYYFYHNISYRIVNFNNMPYACLVKRVKWYIDILQEELDYTQNKSTQFMPWTDTAVNLLFCSPPRFTPDYILYENEGRQLSVSDLLSVAGYTVKFIETIGVKVDDRFSIALQVLDTLDLILKNKPQDKPFNKSLHILNDVLADAAKDAKIKGVSDSHISGISLLFDLAIDFFVKR